MQHNSKHLPKFFRQTNHPSIRHRPRITLNQQPATPSKPNSAPPRNQISATANSTPMVKHPSVATEAPVRKAAFPKYCLHAAQTLTAHSNTLKVHISDAFILMHHPSVRLRIVPVRRVVRSNTIIPGMTSKCRIPHTRI